MQVNDISLAPGIRSVLISLQKTSAGLGKAGEILVSGKSVSTALDNPTSYFAAVAARNKAQDLEALKDGIGDAVQTIGAANAGITAIGQLLLSAQGVANLAMATNDQSARNSYADSFNTILSQIDTLAGDSGFNGSNLIDNGSLSVNLSDQPGSTIMVPGASLDAASLGLTQITVPPISPFFGTSPITPPSLSSIQSQVTVQFDDGEGGNQNNMVAGSVQILDASGNQVQPYAQYEDPTTGLVNFYFTTPPAGESYSAAWDVSLNENKFDAAGPVQQVLVGGSVVPAAQYALSATATGGTKVTFTQGNEPLPGQTVQYVAGFLAPSGGPIQNVILNGTATNSYTTSSSGGGTVISFNGGTLASAAPQVEYVSGYQMAAPGTLQTLLVNNSPVSPAAYSYNPGSGTIVFNQALSAGAAVTYTLAGGGGVHQSAQPIIGDATAMVAALGSGTGSFPRAETSGLLAATPPLVVWPTPQITSSISEVNSAMTELKTYSTNLNSDSTILSVRGNFIDAMANTLTTAADNLTLADMNEEGADAQMLTTRQALAVQSLNMASRVSKGVLKLFG